MINIINPLMAYRVSRIVQTKNFLTISEIIYSAFHVIRPEQSQGETSPRYQSGRARNTLHGLISRAYSQSHELCLEEWENEQRANSCCYRSHSDLLRGLSRIYRSDANRRVESGLSPVSLSSHSLAQLLGATGIIDTVSRVKCQVSSKSVSTCQRINVSTLKPLHVIRPDQTWGETSPRYQSGWARYTLHVLEKHEA